MQPVATSELERLARAGLLKRTDMIWREGMPEWLAAGEIAQIFAPAAVLEQALAAAGPNPLRAPPGHSANQPDVQPQEPILLGMPEETAQARPATDSLRPKKRRWKPALQKFTFREKSFSSFGSKRPRTWDTTGNISRNLSVRFTRPKTWSEHKQNLLQKQSRSHLRTKVILHASIPK